MFFQGCGVELDIMNASITVMGKDRGNWVTESAEMEGKDGHTILKVDCFQYFKKECEIMLLIYLFFKLKSCVAVVLYLLCDHVCWVYLVGKHSFTDLQGSGLLDHS